MGDPDEGHSPGNESCSAASGRVHVGRCLSGTRGAGVCLMIANHVVMTKAGRT